MTQPSGKRAALILGASSDIGLALAHAFAAEGHPILLAARNPLEEDVADIRLRHGVEVSAFRFDATDIASLRPFIESLPSFGIAASVIGLLGNQEETQGNPGRIETIVASNFTGPAILLEACAERIGTGWVIGVSSVAGDRGRARNYWYGASKAALTAMLSGLRQRYAKQGVRVMTVKPGFVATRMTEGMDLIPALTANPEEIAALTLRAMRRRREVVYPFKWWAVMTILRALPERIFRGLNF